MFYFFHLIFFSQLERENFQLLHPPEKHYENNLKDAIINLSNEEA